MILAALPFKISIVLLMRDILASDYQQGRELGKVSELSGPYPGYQEARQVISSYFSPKLFR